jgi:hypothetical protein
LPRQFAHLGRAKRGQLVIRLVIGVSREEKMDHKKEAEDCIRMAENANAEDATYLLARAQVHAILALVEATKSTK